MGKSCLSYGIHSSSHTVDSIEPSDVNFFPQKVSSLEIFKKKNKSQNIANWLLLTLVIFIVVFVLFGLKISRNRGLVSVKSLRDAANFGIKRPFWCVRFKLGSSYTCFSDISTGVLKTVQMTDSWHGGVVRLPLYLQNLDRSEGRKSSKGKDGMSTSSPETKIK